MKPTVGNNLANFRAAQLDFAAHIRHPEIHPRPADVEPQRMQIYVDLFFNNIQNFLASAFPLSKKILGKPRWLALAREFFHLHASESPYFLQISQEFLTFVHTRGLKDLPPFFLELCHYEWVELSLDVAVATYSDDELESFVTTGWDEDSHLLVSPLCRPLVYQFEVHHIGVDCQPLVPKEQPTYLVVYRNAELTVRFLESNVMTHKLLALLQSSSVGESFSKIAKELAVSIPYDRIASQGNQVIEHLIEAGIILGIRR
ncbi:MAG: DUF2063 domain-containing protein [Gammaproteobacteria bacterium]|nr:DUF2063 domain-containing protein [Gammaproteobacteria bacterium]